jgi:syntaxin 5
MVDRRQSKVEN